MNNEFMTKRGMVFYADLGINEDSVQGGLRPVIIVGNNLQGKYGPVITVIPITSKISKKRLMTQTLLINEIGLNRESMAMAEQITTISKDKLVSYIGRLRKETIKEISTCDLLIIGGTSLTVYPAASFIRYFQGKHLVLINRDSTPMDNTCDFVIHDSLGKVFERIEKEIIK